MAGVEEADRGAAEEQAVRRLEEIWQTAHRRQVEAWEAQREEEEARRREEEEEEERRRQEEEERERGRQEEERRKQGGTKKVFAWDNDRGVASNLVNRPAQYALNKLAAVAYVEVDYFTARGCRLAQQDRQTTSADAVGVTQIDGHLSLQSMAALKPVKGIRSDEELTWPEINQGRHNMMRQMLKLGPDIWPVYAVEGWTDLYSGLDAHSIREEEYGEEAVIAYHAKVRREWFDLQARGRGMNPGIINENLLRNLRQEIVTNKGIEAYRQVSSTVNHRNQGTDSRACVHLPPCNKQHGYCDATRFCDTICDAVTATAAMQSLRYDPTTTNLRCT